MTPWIAAFFLGGAVGLDATSFPQAMYSRPLVAGAFGGLVLGRPVEGAMIGALIEFFSLPVLPFGAAGYPEGGTAAVAAAVAYASITDVMHPDLLFLAVVLGLLLSNASGFSVRLLRIRNGRAVGRRQEGAPIAPSQLQRGHLAAMGYDYLRGGLVTAAGTGVIALILAHAARAGWALPVVGLDVLAIAALIMVGGSLTVFGSVRERALPFAVGAAFAAVAVWVF